MKHSTKQWTSQRTRLNHWRWDWKELEIPTKNRRVNIYYWFWLGKGKFPDMTYHLARMFILIFSGEQYAFIFDSAPLEHASSLPPCHTETVGPIFHPLGYGLAFQRNSRYTDLMSQHILQLRESGGLDKLYDKWFRNNNTECDDNGGTFIVMIYRPQTMFGAR